MSNRLIAQKSAEAQDGNSLLEHYDAKNAYDFVDMVISSNRQAKIDPNIKVPFGEDGSEDEPGEPKTAEEVFAADLKDAKKVDVDEARAFFNSNDKQDNQQAGEIDVADEDEPKFTIDEPKKAKEPINFSSFLGDDEADEDPKPEQPKASEKSMSEMEKMHLMAELKQAIEQYNQAIAETVRVEKALEDIVANEPARKEMSKQRIIDTIFSAVDPRNNNRVGRSKLVALAYRLKDEEASKDAMTLKTDLEQIEPALTKIADLLDELLRQTTDSRSVESIRLSLERLIIVSDITKSSIDDIDAMCENRKAEIDEAPKGSAALAQTSDEGEEPSKNIIDQINDEGKKDQSDLSEVGDSVPLGSSEISTGEDNKYVNLTTEPVVAPKDSNPDSPENDSASKLAAQPTEEIVDEPEQAAEPQTSPIVRPQFEELAEIDSGGKIVNEVVAKSTEVDLSKPEGNVNLSAVDLANLKKNDRTTDSTGVINLTREDLEKPLEISKNPTHDIRDRINELKEKPQILDNTKNMFGLEEETVVDVDNSLIVVGDKAEPDKMSAETPSESEESAAFGTEKINPKTQTVEKGPDLKAGAEKRKEAGVGAIEVSKTEHAVAGKARLFGDFMKIFGLGKNKKEKITADMVSAIEGDVERNRSAAVEKAVEQAEQK